MRRETADTADTPDTASPLAHLRARFDRPAGPSPPRRPCPSGPDVPGPWPGQRLGPCQMGPTGRTAAGAVSAAAAPARAATPAVAPPAAQPRPPKGAGWVPYIVPESLDVEWLPNTPAWAPAVSLGPAGGPYRCYHRLTPGLMAWLLERRYRRRRRLAEVEAALARGGLAAEQEVAARETKGRLEALMDREFHRLGVIQSLFRRQFPAVELETVAPEVPVTPEYFLPGRPATT